MLGQLARNNSARSVTHNESNFNELPADPRSRRDIYEYDANIRWKIRVYTLVYFLVKLILVLLVAIKGCILRWNMSKQNCVTNLTMS